jgi:sortase A
MESNTGPIESTKPARREMPFSARLILVPFRLLLIPLVAFRSVSKRLPRGDMALVLATMTAIILVGGATVAVMRSNPTASDLAFDAPTLVAVDVTTTTTLSETTSSTAVAAAPAPLTQPIAPPREPRAKEPIVQIGEIQIPKIGLVHPIFEGVTLTVIDQGPGHWPGSARPGQLGNAVFAGHRVTHSHPFRRINELVAGDDIIFRTNEGVFTYKMTASEVVTPKDVHIVTPTPDATITLFACHPPGSAKQRYVVRGAFAGMTPA